MSLTVPWDPQRKWVKPKHPGIDKEELNVCLQAQTKKQMHSCINLPLQIQDVFLYLKVPTVYLLADTIVGTAGTKYFSSARGFISPGVYQDYR